MSDEPKLLPCPFCGGTRESGVLQFAHGTKYVCHQDEAACSAFRGVLIHVMQWNRRVPAPAVPDDVAAMAARVRRWGGCDELADLIEAQAAELVRLTRAIRAADATFERLGYEPNSVMREGLARALTHPTGEPT